VKHTNNFKWKYTGRDSNYKPKFTRQLEEPLDYVLSFLDSKNIKYIIGKSKSLAIYSRLHKFRYYYTTGKWSRNSGNKNIKVNNKKYYLSKGIEDFYERFFIKNLEKENNIPYIKKIGLKNYGYPRYEYDYIRTVIGEDKSKARNFYLLYYHYKDEKFCPFINREGIKWIQDTDEYINFEKNKDTIQAYVDVLLNKGNSNETH
jgi:hypothetical protein